MQKVLKLIFVLFSLFSVSGVNANCTVNGSDNWYPYYFVHEDTGQRRGIMPDVARTLKSAKGIPIEIVDRIVPWGRQFMALDDGSQGMIGGAYFTQERAPKYHFSESVDSDDVFVFVKRGNEFNFTQLHDLKNKRGIRPKGSLGEQLDSYTTYVLEKIKKKKNANILFRMLEVDRADYAVTSLKPAENEMARTPRFYDTISKLPNPAAENGIYFIVSKTGGCNRYLEAINSAIREFKDNGTIDDIKRRYP